MTTLFYLFQHTRRIGLRRGCDELKKETIGGTLRGNILATMTAMQPDSHRD